MQLFLLKEKEEAKEDNFGITNKTRTRAPLWQFIKPKDSITTYTFPRIISLSTLCLKVEGAFYTLLRHNHVLTFPWRCTTVEVQNPTFLKTSFRGIWNCQCKGRQPSLLKIFHFYCFTWNELTMKSRCLKKKKWETTTTWIIALVEHLYTACTQCRLEYHSSYSSWLALNRMTDNRIVNVLFNDLHQSHE